MKKVINIPKRASGSLKNRLGDETLFYSSDISDEARAVGSIFLDNPPRLSPAHASLVWNYHRSTDRYMLIHVQGSHVVSEGLGRNYPFRASYEVARSDMNTIGFNLAALLSALPRIATMPQGRVGVETEVDIKGNAAESVAARLLRHRIQEALVSGRRMMVEVEPREREWREDGVFECRELQTVLSALDNIPISLRRYATFAFCVDENFTQVLDGVQLVFCRKGCSLSAKPDDIKMTWEQALKPPEVSPQLDNIVKVCPLPGEKEPLQAQQEVATSYQVFAKSPSQLKESEWHLWLKLGHSLEEVRPISWSEFKKYYSNIPTTLRPQFIKAIRTRSIGWGLDGLDAGLYSQMGYDEHEQLQFQQLAMGVYLESGKYAYLFSAGLHNTLKKQLNINYLQGLNLQDETAIDKWIGIYKQYDRFDKQVEKEFTKLLLSKAHKLHELKDIVAFMAKYPFVPIDVYNKPRKIETIPVLTRLNNEQRRVVEGWLQDAANDYQFTTIDMVLKAAEQGETRIEYRTLATLTTEQLISLLIASGPKKPIKCEQLHSATQGVPGLKKKVSDAIDAVLFGAEGCWNDKHLMTVDNWDDLVTYQEACPNVFERLELRMDDLLNELPEDEIDNMTARVIQLYSSDSEGEDEENSSQKKKTTAPLEINSFVEKFVKTVMKRDSKKGTALQKRLGLSDKRQVIMGSIGGLVLGALLASLILWFFPWKGSASTPTSEPQPNNVLLITSDSDGLMAILAEESSRITCLKFDTLSIKLDSTLLCNDSTLLCINKMSLNSKMQEMKVRISELRNGITFTDSIQTISKEYSLLQLLAERSCRVDSVMISDDFVIGLPKDTLIDTVTGILPANYYFKIINDIELQLIEQKKEDVRNKIPY